jgi:hypothetical protein
LGQGGRRGRDQDVGQEGEGGTRAKIIEAEQNDIRNEEYVEESNKKRSEREREIDTSINHNEEAIYSTYI